MSDQDTALHRAEMPPGTSEILNTRTLQTAHKRLSELLRPGISVLDVGCGTGAITRGIAEAVAPNGRVVGLDPNRALIEEARSLHGGVPGLSFEIDNVYELAHGEEFDIVTAARVLQWLADPPLAIRGMAAAAKPGGSVVVLDYNHEKVRWTPPPPPSMQIFYAAFLHWRAEAGMDNAIADRLAEMFRRTGLQDVRQSDQHEHTTEEDGDFQTRIGIWEQVTQTRGRQMVKDGFIAEVKRRGAAYDYREWAETEAESQTLYLICAEGVKGGR